MNGPKKPPFVLTDPQTFTRVYPWGAEVTDKKTGEVKIVPEKPPRPIEAVKTAGTISTTRKA